MAMTAMKALRALRACLQDFGPEAAQRKLDLLGLLEHSRLASASQVEALHEALCFLRAYPDSEALLKRVVRLLKAFASRPDLRAHAEELASSGISGTPIWYSFFFPTATWLARRWPAHLHLDWDQIEEEHLVGAFLPLLGVAAEDLAIDEAEISLRELVDEMRGPTTPDGTYLAQRMERLSASPATQQILYDSLELPLILTPGRTTPNRTQAAWPVKTVHYQVGRMERGRPDLAVAVRETPKAVVAVSAREGAQLIELAREAMVSRSRDLEVFMHGDPRDVRRVVFEDGLEFAMIGMRPERRLLLESVYGFLTLKNGVPIGYVLASALYGSAAIAYNVFETWRGGESARIYGKILAMARHLLGADTFSVDPYQLGHDNDEGLDSGAWWFYYKLGFRPRDPAVLHVLARELAALRRRPAHRSSRSTLQNLSAAHVFLPLGRARSDVLGAMPLGQIGLAVLRSLARRNGGDREAMQEEAAKEAATLLDARRQNAWTREERAAFVAWSPLVLSLAGLARWSKADRHALRDVMRAKGGRRESEFVARFDAHAPLRRAILALAKKGAYPT